MFYYMHTFGDRGDKCTVRLREWWPLGSIYQGMEAAGKILAVSKKKKVTRHYTKQPSSKVHSLYLHPCGSSWVSSTTYSNSLGYNAVFLINGTIKNFLAYQSSTKPPQTATSWHYHFPPLSPQPSPQNVTESVKKYFGFILRHWLFCYLSPSYFEIKTELFAFFPLKKSSSKTKSPFTQNVGARNLHFPHEIMLWERHPTHISWVHGNWR